MMTRTVRCLVAAVVAWGFLCCVDCPHVQGAQADVDRLLELQAKGGSKGFHALLKLREVGNERAIPALEKIVRKHHGTGNIFGYGAAQALFCIGTEKAHQILRKYVLSDKYEAALGIRYTFYWKMEPAKRDAFIEQYHLKSTSRELAIELAAKSSSGAGTQRIDFSVALRNVSQKPLRLYKPGVYLGDLLVLRSAAGHFTTRLKHVEYQYRIGKESFPVLAPGKELSFSIVGRPRWMDLRHWKRHGVAQPRALVLECRDMFHLLGKPGKFTVYAMYSVGRRMVEGQGKRLGLGPVWSGRVVSKPVEIEIQPVAGSQGRGKD